MTVNDLIDYLGQFPRGTTVVLTEADANNLPECDYISLESLDFALAIDEREEN